MSAPRGRAGRGRRKLVAAVGGGRWGQGDGGEGRREAGGTWVGVPRGGGRWRPGLGGVAREGARRVPDSRRFVSARGKRHKGEVGSGRRRGPSQPGHGRKVFRWGRRAGRGDAGPGCAGGGRGEYSGKRPPNPCGRVKPGIFSSSAARTAEKKKSWNDTLRAQEARLGGLGWELALPPLAVPCVGSCPSTGNCPSPVEFASSAPLARGFYSFMARCAHLSYSVN